MFCDIVCFIFSVERLAIIVVCSTTLANIRELAAKVLFITRLSPLGTHNGPLMVTQAIHQ